MHTPKTVILIGAGDRGRIYTSYARRHPDRLKVVAVAEPVLSRRDRLAAEHAIDPSRCFEGWEDILARPRMADGAIIATQDHMHAAPAVAALEQGYEVLLEKPMALTQPDLERLVATAQRTGKTLNVCHVLRYTAFFQCIKDILEAGRLGEIYSILHAENVAYYHMAHSYVRGNWGSSTASSPMIMAKCCHDLDLIAWYAGTPPLRIGSIGALSHFRAENAPPGAPAYCIEGCPAAERCLYNAIDLYLHGLPIKRELAKTGFPLAAAARFMLAFPALARRIPGLRDYSVWKEWPTSTITEDLTPEGILRALRGPYGRCVYRCDNDQMDHQETMIEFAGGITAVLRMHGHSEQETRTLRIDGSLGTLKAVYGGRSAIEVYRHDTGKRIVFPVKTDLIGHGEGDYGIVENFVHVLNGGRGRTDAQESFISHRLALAAHAARLANRVMEL